MQHSKQMKAVTDVSGFIRMVADLPRHKRFLRNILRGVAREIVNVKVGGLCLLFALRFGLLDLLFCLPGHPGHVGRFLWGGD